MFPVIYHGFGRSMWYAQWVCNKLFPLKQMCFSEIIIKNTRDEKKKRKDELKKLNVSTTLFNNNVIDGSFTWVRRKIANLNKKIYNKEVDKSPITFSINDLKTIYDINNEDFKSRNYTKGVTWL